MTRAVDGRHPAVWAGRVSFPLPAPVPPQRLRAAVEEFVAHLLGWLRRQGCPLVGHIKGLLDTDAGMLGFSVTSLEERVRWRGNVTGAVAAVTVTLNAIVYGVPEELLAEAVKEGLRTYLGTPGAAR
ncbi:MAG: hypothetical protein AB1503_12715 [Bacillota bacterium]